MTVTIASFAFLLLVGAVYYLFPKAARKYILALAGILYAFKVNLLAAGSVVIVSVLAYGGALLIYYSKLRLKGRLSKALTCIFAFIFSLNLLLIKYIPAYYGRFFSGDSIFTKIVMPVGFSFYVFQVISYIVDVYRGSAIPSRNPIDVLLYLSFFPKFVSGPIERWHKFNGQVKKLKTVSFFDANRWIRVVYYLLFGCFLKMVVADRIGAYVDRIFDGYSNYGSLILVMGALFYTVQIYCDFAGYSYVAVGAALLFGIELSPNFEMPYCSKNITEFWRRWHMSLSSFLLDYVYIPLGGNKKGHLKKQINTMIVFLVSGLWHGTGLNFVAWGLLHGLYSVADSGMRRRGINLLRKGVLGNIITFLEVSFAWIFFRSTSLRASLKYIYCMMTNGLRLGKFTSDLSVIELKISEIIVIMVLVIIVMLLDYIAYRLDECIPEMISAKEQTYRYIVFYLLFVAVMILGIYGPDMGSRLIYMQF